MGVAWGRVSEATTSIRKDNYNIFACTIKPSHVAMATMQETMWSYTHLHI